MKKRELEKRIQKLEERILYLEEKMNKKDDTEINRKERCDNETAINFGIANEKIRNVICNEEVDCFEITGESEVKRYGVLWKGVKYFSPQLVKEHIGEKVKIIEINNSIHVLNKSDEIIAIINKCI